MKKNSRSWRAIGMIILVTLIVSVFTALMSGIMYAQSQNKTKVLPVRWEVKKYTSDGHLGNVITTDLTKVNFKKSGKGIKVVATATIPDGSSDGITLQMCLKRTAYQVKISGGRYYTYAIGRYIKRKSIGNGYHFIHITQKDYGEKIKIVFRANGVDSYNNIRQVKFYDGADMSVNLASRNFVLILLCNFLIVFGIILTVLGVVLVFREKTYAQFLYLGIFSFMMGLYVISSRYLLQIFNDDLLTDTLIEYFTMFLLPVSIALFLLEITEKDRKIYRLFLGIYAFIDFVATIAVGVAYRNYNLHLNQVSGYYREYMILGIVVVFIVEAKNILKPKSDKLKVSGFLVLIFSNSITLASFLIFGDTSEISEIVSYLMPVGNIYLILALLFSYLTEYMRMFKDDVEKNILLKMAYTDPMTSLFNRARSMEEFSKLDSENKHYCVVWLDLNYLKKTNDRYGHEEGDLLLINFAGILRKAFEDIGTVCRMGGDEFCVIIDKSMNDNRIKKGIDKMLSFIDDDNKGKHRYFMQTSYGVAGSEEFDEPTSDKVCSIADERMYKMKVEMKAQRTD